MLLTFYKEAVECGFPSPARDFTEGTIDLNEELIPHPNATFIVRARGDSMVGSGIYPGDLLIVDRSIKPRNESIIIAVLDGELSVKILRLKNKQVNLSSSNKNYADVPVSEEMDFTIWGVCTNVIHNLSP